jgi:2-dehydro-3-deoxy-D-arabinonate dehydratase
MKLYKTAKGIFLKDENSVYKLNQQWDELVNRDGLYNYLSTQTKTAEKITGDDWQVGLLPPVASQEVWAAGVTYLQSRDARVEESQSSGGSDLYKRVYDADRPEIFFKSAPWRVVGHGQDVAIRKDSAWDVPEPELTFLSTQKEVFRVIL